MKPQTPQPIVREQRIRGGKDADVVIQCPFGMFNLTTGEVAIARVIDGVCYDTADAILLIGHGELRNGYHYDLWRLYLTDEGTFFRVRLQWTNDLGVVASDFVRIVKHEDVLWTVRGLLEPVDLYAFLRDWYATGWLPRDDSVVRRWIERRFDPPRALRLLSLLGPTPVTKVRAKLRPGPSVMPCG